MLEAVEVPTIHFGTGTAGILSHMRDAGGDVIGLDWRVELDRGWAAVGLDRGVQGNLDPAVLLGPWERVEAAARGRPARGPAAAAAMSSTSATACCRNRPGCPHAAAALVQEQTA